MDHPGEIALACACYATKRLRTIDGMGTYFKRRRGIWFAPPRGRTVVALSALTICSALAAKGDSLSPADGQSVPGRLVSDPAQGIVFRPHGGGATTRLQTGMIISFDGQKMSPTESTPPFRLDLGYGQRLSGRLGVVGDRSVQLDEGPGKARVEIARPGVLSIVQRPGEVQVLHDDFETLDNNRWSEVGTPDVVKTKHVVGERSLRLPGGAAAVTCRLPQPVGAGRFDVSFFDSGDLVPGQQCFVDLLFRGATGPEPVRALMGWADETLGVESPRGPTMAVQRLLRTAGWHRLSVRFGPDHTEIAVDGNELAYGRGPGGPLVEVRLATTAKGKATVPDGLAVFFDDLSLVKVAQPSASVELDTQQDEARLIQGDQVFGALRKADADRAVLRVLGKDVLLPWSEVSGLYLRRNAVPGQPIDGLLVRLEWRAAPGNDPADLDQVEGALTGVSDSSLTLATPYAGTLTIPRDRMRRLHVLGQGRRVVIDPTAHHLGNEVRNADPFIDPPMFEGGVLERSFTLDAVPAEPAFVVIDVVDVVGESNGLHFSDEVRNGWLRTYVNVNGKAIDYLNRHISTQNETRETVRLPVPHGVLKAGENRLRIEQKGRQNNPDDLDDLGVLGIALEFSTSPAAGPVNEKP